MISIILIIKKLWKKDEEFRALFYILFVLLLTGTAFYSLVENWRVVDSIYFCIMTISTIGYGDITPQKDISKIFTIIFAIGGIGIFVGIVSKVAQGLTRRQLDRKTGHEDNRAS